MTNKIKIELYNDVQKNISDINAWHDIKMFDFSALSNNETYELKHLCAIDITFPGIGSQRKQIYFEKQIKSFNLFVEKILLENKNYMYLMEYNSNIQNKIRSYKGLFHKKNVKYYFQKEYLINKPYSIIAAILPINKDNLDFFTQLYDSNCSFVISSKLQFLSLENILDNLVNNYIFISPNGNTINYLKIISDYCNEKTRIYRIMGDGGEDSFTFQIFCTKADATILISNLKQLLINLFTESQIQIYTK
ncbi:hypothetical protein [Coprobacter sp.]